MRFRLAEKSEQLPMRAKQSGVRRLVADQHVENCEGAGQFMSKGGTTIAIWQTIEFAS